jgi:hypothetical protein
MADDEQWWWCQTHGVAEQGPGCRAQDRLGPYPTAEAAASWKSTHEGREDAWDAEDDRWEGDASQP